MVAVDALLFVLNGFSFMSFVSVRVDDFENPVSLIRILRDFRENCPSPVSIRRFHSIFMSSNDTGEGKKVNLSLCLNKHHAMKAYWGSGGIAPRILDLGTRCM
jgi:hypothetical protein